MARGGPAEWQTALRSRQGRSQHPRFRARPSPANPLLELPERYTIIGVSDEKSSIFLAPDSKRLTGKNLRRLRTSRCGRELSLSRRPMPGLYDPRDGSRHESLLSQVLVGPSCPVRWPRRACINRRAPGVQVRPSGRSTAGTESRRIDYVPLAAPACTRTSPTLSP